VLDAGASVFSGQGRQKLALSAFEPARYLPDTQSVQTSGPCELLNLPGTHAVQALLGVCVHTLFNGSEVRSCFLSSSDTVFISVSFRWLFHIKRLVISQSLFSLALQLMQSCVARSIVALPHSFWSESDLVLVPDAAPSIRIFNGVEPPFLLHMTSQSVCVPTFCTRVLKVRGVTVPV
jgi:hypothetical protein